jgi:hypothetical protein
VLGPKTPLKVLVHWPDCDGLVASSCHRCSAAARPGRRCGERPLGLSWSPGSGGRGAGLLWPLVTGHWSLVFSGLLQYQGHLLNCPRGAGLLVLLGRLHPRGPLRHQPPHDAPARPAVARRDPPPPPGLRARSGEVPSHPLICRKLVTVTAGTGKDFLYPPK